MSYARTLVLGLVLMAARRSSYDGAQGMTGVAATDSAAVARAAYARMLAARRANDPGTACAEAARAAAARPTQPAYQWARAVVSARTRAW